MKVIKINILYYLHEFLLWYTMFIKLIIIQAFVNINIYNNSLINTATTYNSNIKKIFAYHF